MAQTTALTDVSRRWIDALNQGTESYLSTLSSLTEQATKMMPRLGEGPTADISALMTDAGKAWVSTMEQLGELYVSALSFWSEVAAATLPNLPALPIPAGLPDPEKFIDAGFDFADRILAAERACAHKAFEAVAPITDKMVPNPPADEGAKAPQSSRQASSTQPAAPEPAHN